MLSDGSDCLLNDDISFMVVGVSGHQLDVHLGAELVEKSFIELSVSANDFFGRPWRHS